VEIRTAQLADVPALEPLFEQWGHPLPPEDLRDHVCRWRDAPGAEFSVALVHGELAGMAAIAVVPHLGRPGCAAKQWVWPWLNATAARGWGVPSSITRPVEPWCGGATRSS
jgi:hypothetical protein